ncbi:HAD-IA family hydrolase [Saccharopolyspora erythraea]|nr:HAD-IA family hydrolase [Saccharopolyspora erythraea]
MAAACGSLDAARALVAEWSGPAGEVDAEVAGLLAGARAHLCVVLVTNATTRLEADLERLGLTNAVDAVVNSSRVGCAKPDPRIYRLAAARAGAAVERCLFVDDTAANVEAARDVGMTALHFRQPHQLREAFAPLLEPRTA